MDINYLYLEHIVVPTIFLVTSWDKLLEFRTCCSTKYLLVTSWDKLLECRTNYSTKYLLGHIMGSTVRMYNKL